MKYIVITLSSFLLTFCSFAQDIGIDVQPMQDGVQNSAWTPGHLHQIVVTISNNGPGDLSAWRIRPFVSVGPGVSFNAAQPNLPAGWNLVFNAPGQANQLPGQSIRFSNGTDLIPEASAVEFRINVTVTANNTYSPTATVAFSTGVAPGSASGPQTTNNLVGNDNSVFPFSTTGFAPLPLSLTSFTATEKNCNAIIAWKTSNEVNTKNFEIESSKDGIEFTTVENITAKGTNSVYSVIVSQNNRTAYYRIKCIDLDGTFSYSAIVPLNISCQPGDYMFVYPNPVSRQANTTISFYTSYKGLGTIRVTNSVGQLISTTPIAVNKGVNNKLINTDTYLKGAYYITVVDALGNTIGDTQKIIKN